MVSRVVPSLQYEQGVILTDILNLHGNGASQYDVDVTFGSGVFYKTCPDIAPRLRFDLDPQVAGVVEADSRNLPVETGSLNSVVFDPPFLTYVRAGREGNGSMVMAKRFAGYWTYGELTDHYVETLKEGRRVLQRGGIMVVKCQDIVHNHRLHLTHMMVIQEAEKMGFRAKDLFVLGATHRMPSPNRKGTQKHSRIFHSYFIVLSAQ
jgi:tRNA G10  N-methylase Trm11